MSFTSLMSLTPRLPGLPPLAFNALTLFSGEIKALDALNPINLLFSTSQPVWGLFDDGGQPVVEPDSVLSFEYKNDWSLSDYPQEQGAFNTYNKVNSPFDARLRMSKGGTVSDMTDFLTALQQAGDSLDLYSIVTPEVTYLNANIAHIDYRRTQSEGANIIVVDVWLREVRSASQITKFSVTESGGGSSLMSKITGAVSNAVGGGVSFLKNTVKSIGSTASSSLGQLHTYPPSVQQLGEFD